ncbi:band 7 protein [Ruminococcus sp. CAG:353]|nr:band 7 protein [Ruminococcus sp. CAG:353]
MKEKKELISTVEEKELNAPNGLAVGILSVLVYIAAAVGVIPAAMALDNGSTAFGALLMVMCVLWLCVGWIPFMGVKVIRPNEALVLTLFGKYTGTLKKEGIFFVNPFSIAVNPASAQKIASGKNPQEATAPVGKKLSLKAMTLDNKKQKINDRDGNPIEISIVVIWKIANTAKAVFNVDNYEEYVSIQSDSALRDVAGAYPYDGDGENVKSLRGSSAEIAGHLRDMLQSRVDDAGIEVIEARITHLAYAPEIAAAMLQRQQAAAIIEARQKIVDGAVGMVEMALERLSENHVCELDEERKAQMVSNLLVVLCGNKDAQPIVNSGSIY